jgi:hypothetical protein
LGGFVVYNVYGNYGLQGNSDIAASYSGFLFGLTLQYENVVCSEKFNNAFIMRFGHFFFFFFGFHCFDDLMGPWTALIFVSSSVFQCLERERERNISMIL